MKGIQKSSKKLHPVQVAVKKVEKVLEGMAVYDAKAALNQVLSTLDSNSVTKFRPL
jgi:hypothetical protein